MSRETPEGRLLTQYEHALDNHHRTLRLWSRPRSHAALSLLGAFDLFMLPLTVGVAVSNPRPYVVQQVKWFHDSLMYALRFLWQDAASTFGPLELPVDREAIREAAEFLIHCKDYSVLSDFHIGYGRGRYTLEADAVHRRIRFVPAPVAGAAPEPCGILEEYPKGWEHLQRLSEQRDLGRQFVAAMRAVPHHFEAGRVVLGDMTPLTCPAVEHGVRVLVPEHDIPLGDAADMGGFSAGDFRKVWHALVKWSVAASGAYFDAARSGRSQEDHLPTQLVGRSEFIESLTRLTAMPANTVSTVVERLTFGRDCPDKPDIFLQPLVADDRQVAWSAFLFQIAAGERNMLKLMARIPRLKATADSLIGERERVVCRRLGEVLAGHGYQFKTRIPLPGGVGEIDVLAFHSKYPTELLAIEVKGVLDVDEVNEVEHVTRELLGGQVQLRRAAATLAAMTPVEKQRLWSKIPWNSVESVFCVLLTPSAQPNAGFDQREYPAVTLETVQNYYYPGDFRSPRKFWQAAVGKRWLRQFRQTKLEYDEIAIADVTYEVPANVLTN